MAVSVRIVRKQGRGKLIRTFIIEDDSFMTMLLLLGYATGSAIQQGQMGLANSFIGLTNEINKDNPNYTPYELLPEDYEQKEVPLMPRRSRRRKGA